LVNGLEINYLKSLSVCRSRRLFAPLCYFESISSLTSLFNRWPSSATRHLLHSTFAPHFVSMFGGTVAGGSTCSDGLLLLDSLKLKLAFLVVCRLLGNQVAFTTTVVAIRRSFPLFTEVGSSLNCLHLDHRFRSFVVVFVLRVSNIQSFCQSIVVSAVCNACEPKTIVTITSANMLRCFLLLYLVYLRLLVESRWLLRWGCLFWTREKVHVPRGALVRRCSLNRPRLDILAGLDKAVNGQEVFEFLNEKDTVLLGHLEQRAALPSSQLSAQNVSDLFNGVKGVDELTHCDKYLECAIREGVLDVEELLVSALPLDRLSN